jgi:cytosine/uracil/thiamine/allantoin permease
MIIANLFPRFLDQVGIKGIPTGDQNLYMFALPVGICISGGVYWGLCV